MLRPPSYTRTETPVPYPTRVRMDGGRHRALPFEFNCVGGEARGEVVIDVGGDTGTGHEHDGKADRDDAHEVREGMRRGQATVTGHCAAAAPCGLDRAHADPDRTSTRLNSSH